MGFFSFLTGGSQVAEKVVDGAVSGLDMVFYTNEEKAIAGQKILDWKLAYAKATAHMSISRRILVVVISFVWLLLVLLMVVIGIAFGGDHASVAFLFKVMKEIVAIPFSIIIGFYFLAQVVGKGKGAP